MFRGKLPKAAPEPAPDEARRIRTTFLRFRSKALEVGKPAENIHKLIRMISK